MPSHTSSEQRTNPMPKSPGAGGLADAATHHRNFREASVGGEKNAGVRAVLGEPLTNPQHTVKERRKAR